MSMLIQQPVHAGRIGEMEMPPLSQPGSADLQAKLSELVLQIINLLLQEIMKAAQGAQGAPSTPDMGNAAQQRPPQSYAPPDQNAFGGTPSGRPQGGLDQGQGGGAPPVTQAQPLATPTPISNASGASDKAPGGMPADLWQGCVEAGKKTGVDPYLLAAQMEKESQFGKGLKGDSAGDGLMQVEPGTRQAYAGKFQEKMGHAYDHNDPKDQIAMAGVILADKGGDARNMLQKYNGGDNWTPGTTDSYQREIKPDEYATTVLARAAQMKQAGV